MCWIVNPTQRATTGTSAATGITNHDWNIRCDGVQPRLERGCIVHLDATYWGLNWGVMLALDKSSGKPLYMAFIAHERVQDFVDAVRSIEERGYTIRGIVICHKGSTFGSLHANTCHIESLTKVQVASLRFTDR